MQIQPLIIIASDSIQILPQTTACWSTSTVRHRQSMARRQCREQLQSTIHQHSTDRRQSTAHRQSNAHRHYSSVGDQPTEKRCRMKHLLELNLKSWAQHTIEKVSSRRSRKNKLQRCGCCRIISMRQFVLFFNKCALLQVSSFDIQQSLYNALCYHI